MKVMYLSMAFALALLAPFFMQNASAEDTFSDNYNKSQLVLAGKVLSLEQRHNQTAYEIQVEKYYKNPQSAKVIAVFGPPKGFYYMHDPTFDVGDRLFLYLEKRDGVWAIQNPSFRLPYSCDAGILVPPAFDMYLRGMPASDGSPIFSDADFNGNIYKVGNKMQIKYTVHNYTPFIKHATVTLMVNGTDKTVFSDQKTVLVPACNGSVPITWDFTPQTADDYIAQAQVTANYDIQNYLMIITEPYVANSFQARTNAAGGSLDKTAYPIYFTEQDFQTYSFDYKSYRYNIPYKITGASINKMELNCATTSLLVYLQKSEGGNLTINIPRKALDTKEGQDDIDFIILIDGQEAPFDKIESNAESRTLGIPVAKDTKIIEIIATQLISQMPSQNTMFCGIGNLEKSLYYSLLSPLQQFESEMPLNEIQCKQGMAFAQKANNGNPICVKPNTLEKLKERGWIDQPHSYAPDPDHN